MLTSVKERLDREDEGFTLIELMVVVLIIAILLAIAIPTFLGARNTANARSTQENLRNALTAEQTNYTAQQSFASNLSTLEGALTWSSGAISSKGGTTVSVSTFTATASSTAITNWTGTGSTDGVMLMGYGKDNNCYAIFQSNNSAADFTAYSEWQASSTGCTAPTSPPLAGPTAGSSASAQAVGATAAWYASF